MTEQKKSITKKVNDWLKNPRTFLLLGLLVIVIIVAGSLFAGNPEKRYLDKQGWNLEINSGSKKYQVNVYFDGEHAYGFVPHEKELSRKNASNVKYDRKGHTVTVYNSRSKMKFIVPKTHKDHVSGAVMIGNSSMQYSYTLTKDDAIHLK